MVTFCDVLKMYPSAKPGIERLCEMIGDIKPPDFSIASSQSVVGDRPPGCYHGLDDTVWSVM
jgi:sulfite reductase (NADPH) flavoprotein alpha-component